MRPMLTLAGAVREANAAFYEAFTGADMRAMTAIWAHSQPVACIHPGWQVIHGRDAVLASWRAIMESGGVPPLRCEDVRVTLYDQLGLVTCTERSAETRLAATNVFVLEAGLWRMVHHQAGPYTARAMSLEPPPPPERLN